MWTLKMTLKSMKMMIDGDRLIEPNYREDQEAICRSGNGGQVRVALGQRVHSIGFDSQFGVILGAFYNKW